MTSAKGSNQVSQQSSGQLSTFDSQNKVFITGTGLYIPPYTISNAQLVEAYNAYAESVKEDDPEAQPLPLSSEAFIEKASGIKQRYVVEQRGVLDPKVMHPLIDERSDDELSIQCEMSVHAAEAALGRAGVQADTIDLVIVACSNMQRAYPAIAIEVQSQLGTRGYAYDMNVACSSATFGIEAASNAIRAGQAKRVLVINPEITSGHLEWRDRDCHFIFGDVCTATLVESAPKLDSNAWAFEIVSSRLLTQFSNNIRNNFGFLNRCSPEGVGKRDKTFYQQGRKVFKEVVPMVSQVLSEHILDAGLMPEQIQRLWLHQANLSMNQLIAQRVLGREASVEEAPVILDEFANTSSAGSIIALHRHSEDLKSDSYGLLCSFGAGYSIGSILLRRH